MGMGKHMYKVKTYELPTNCSRICMPSSVVALESLALVADHKFAQCVPLISPFVASTLSEPGTCLEETMYSSLDARKFSEITCIKWLHGLTLLWSGQSVIPVSTAEPRSHFGWKTSTTEKLSLLFSHTTFIRQELVVREKMDKQTYTQKNQSIILTTALQHIVLCSQSN